MPADSDTKSGPVPGAAATVEIEPADGRAPSAWSSASVPRPLLGEIAARVAQAVRGLRKDSTIRESIEEVIEESERETQNLSSQERLMLANLLTFGELAVSDVMVPRADIVAVEEQTPFAEAVALFPEAQHSPLPIYRETLDDPLGMAHIKDIVALVDIGADCQLHWPPTPLSKLKREVLFVLSAMPALDLVMKMQVTRIHMALVVDDYGRQGPRRTDMAVGRGVEGWARLLARGRARGKTAAGRGCDVWRRGSCYCDISVLQSSAHDLCQLIAFAAKRSSWTSPLASGLGH